ncbi:hypothetical protein FQN53_001194 [Emmonsiellopsis sp. PD_33]|nr:hypothetical protein FQN53_001194 [Emmonsiellopsis sp. PD_33]
MHNKYRIHQFHPALGLPRLRISHPLKKQETVPTHPVENNDEEGSISEKNRQASQLVQDKEAQIAHLDGSKEDQEEEDDEEKDYEENDKAQVAHSAGDDGDGKEDGEEEDNEGANPIYKTNRYYILTLLNLIKKALALVN